MGCAVQLGLRPGEIAGVVLSVLALAALVAYATLAPPTPGVLTPTIAAIFVVVLALVFVLVIGFDYVGYSDSAVYLRAEGRRALARNRAGSAWRKLLFMTYHRKEKIPPAVMDMFARNTAGYERVVHDDAEALAFIEQHFVPAVHARALQLQGAHRADLFRFCWLYVRGGAYLDVKTVLLRPLDEIVPPPTHVMAVKTTVPGAVSHIGILWGAPGATLFGLMLDRLMRTRHALTRLCYHVNCYTLCAYAAKHCAEPILWLTEECAGEHCAATGGQDRHGLCCVIKHPEKGVVFYSRDPAYPY